jgi:methionine aminopeptidase
LVDSLVGDVAVKPGTKYRDIGNVIQKHAQSQGFSVVRSYCGHGIHRLFHTTPSIPHYASSFTIHIHSRTVASFANCEYSVHILRIISTLCANFANYLGHS